MVLFQVRGSIPMLWSQPPNVLLRPPAFAIKDKLKQESVFSLFTENMIARYQVSSGFANVFDLPSYNAAKSCF
jgi:hypothetical protein